MSNLRNLLAAGAVLAAACAHAADYKCSNKDTSVKLNDYDISIKNRAEAIAEMQDEAKAAGGTTEQHKKALEGFEEKLAKAKADREALLKDCPAKTAP